MNFREIAEREEMEIAVAAQAKVLVIWTKAVEWREREKGKDLRSILGAELAPTLGVCASGPVSVSACTLDG